MHPYAFVSDLAGYFLKLIDKPDVFTHINTAKLQRNMYMNSICLIFHLHMFLKRGLPHKCHMNLPSTTVQFLVHTTLTSTITRNITICTHKFLKSFNAKITDCPGN